MANKQRGETKITIAGKEYPMRLTLGALAELEDELGVTTPGELDNIIARPTYSQLITMVLTLINFRQETPVITREEIVAADMPWQGAFFAIVAVVKAANPDADKEGKESEGETAT